MTKPTLPRFLACLALCAAAHGSADEVYRWVDENGVVNYTQQKPRGLEVEKLTTRTGSPTVVRNTPVAAPAEPASNATELTQEQSAMLEDLRAAERARLDEIARIRDQNCAKSRGVLSRLSAKERIRVVENSGEERTMSEDERQRRISEAQQGIVENCSPA